MKARFIVSGVVFAVVPCVAQPPVQKVRIVFNAQVAGRPFACGATYDNIGSSHAQVTPLDLRFFVSRTELLTPDGAAVALSLDQDGIWQYRNLALLDFEDGTAGCLNGNAGINNQILGTVPAGRYTGLRFQLGVPFELDHIPAATAPSPLNTAAMFWSWQDGFKFLRVEVATVASSHHANGFPIHVGSTGCAVLGFGDAPAEECAHPNRATVSFRTFDIDHDTVVFDLARLLAGADLESPSPVHSPGCMSFSGTAACVAPMRALGLPFDGAPATEQSVFTRGARH